MREEGIDTLISTVFHGVGELGLGLAAWGLALAGLFLKREKKTLSMLGMGSLACCAASLCLVVFELAHYADIEDISAFLDTVNAFRFCSGALLAVTLGLNGILALRLRTPEG